VEDFLRFAETMKEQGFLFYFEGFALDPRESADAGVALEAIYQNGEVSPQVGLDFARFVMPFHPDEMNLNGNILRAWWD
jgi:hypothetical protein